MHELLIDASFSFASTLVEVASNSVKQEGNMNMDHSERGGGVVVLLGSLDEFVLGRLGPTCKQNRFRDTQRDTVVFVHYISFLVGFGLKYI